LGVGEMTTIAGGGKQLGDGGPALRAGFCLPDDVARDASGNLYVADAGAFCDGPGGDSVRRIDRSGRITTVAGGGGVVGFGGDGGPATKAQLATPLGVAVDRRGDVYIADADNFRVRKVNAHGVITTVAGTGKPGFFGDGGPATAARLTSPGGMVVDDRGNLYVADYAAVRRIDPSGRITTVAGTGRSRRPFDPEHINPAPRTRFTGEGGRATDATLHTNDVALDPHDNLIIADDAGDRIYRVDRHGTITTIAGTVSGKGTRLGDRGRATSAFLDNPAAVAVDRHGNVLIADHHHERIRKVDTNGTITTIAGIGGVKGFSGDRGPATKLRLADPAGLALDDAGLLYVADLFNARIRAIRYQP
jgi:sugar lactone lactonase YvrE